MKTNPNDTIHPVQTGSQISYSENEYDHKSDEKTIIPIMEGGLTKREYFASCALQALLASPMISEVIKKIDRHKMDAFNKAIAKDAIMNADNLIIELNK